MRWHSSAPSPCNEGEGEDMLVVPKLKRFLGNTLRAGTWAGAGAKPGAWGKGAFDVKRLLGNTLRAGAWAGARAEPGAWVKGAFDVKRFLGREPRTAAIISIHRGTNDNRVQLRITIQSMNR